MFFQYPENLLFIQDYSEQNPMSNTKHTLTHLNLTQTQERYFYYFDFTAKDMEGSKMLSNLSTESRAPDSYPLNCSASPQGQPHKSSTESYQAISV